LGKEAECPRLTSVGFGAAAATTIFGGAGVTTGNGDAYKTITNPNGGAGGIIVPNGNGTSTIIMPDGTVKTVPSTK